MRHVMLGEALIQPFMPRVPIAEVEDLDGVEAVDTDEQAKLDEVQGHVED